MLKDRVLLNNHPEIKEVMCVFRIRLNKKINTFIAIERWIINWEEASERISSLHPGIHFRHYKAHAHLIEISKIKCRLVNLAVQNGHPLNRWTRVVSVMLETSPGNINVQNLRAILLLKAYVNAPHKIIFNGRIVIVL